MSDAAEEIVESAATPAEGEAGEKVIEEEEGAKPSEQTDKKEVGEKGGSPTEKPEGAEPLEKSNTQKRIDKISGEKARLAERNAYLEGEAAGRKSVETPKQAEGSELVKPNMEDFETNEDYVEALTDYKMDVKLTERDKVNAEKASQEKAETAQAKAQEGFNEQITKAREKHDDFDDVVMNNQNVAITADMLNVMQESSLGAEVAYHLGKNPEEALRIAKLSPTAQAMAIGRIEGILDAPIQNTIPPKRASTASEPVGKGIQGKGAVPAKDLSSMSMEDYARERLKKVSGG